MIAAWVSHAHAGDQRAMILRVYPEDQVAWYAEPETQPRAPFPSEPLAAATHAVAHGNLDALVLDVRELGVEELAWLEARLPTGRFRPLGPDSWWWETPYAQDPRTLHAEARRAAHVHAGFGDLYRERIRMVNRRAAGYKPWPHTRTNVPYGYTVVAGEVVADPDQLRAIREGIGLRAAGATYSAVGRYWLQVGFTPRPDTRGRRASTGWDTGTVRKILLRGQADELEPIAPTPVGRRFLPGAVGA